MAHEKYNHKYKMANILVFDAWEMVAHSYDEFIDKCAIELQSELRLIKDNKEEVLMVIEEHKSLLEKMC